MEKSIRNSHKRDQPTATQSTLAKKIKKTIRSRKLPNQQVGRWTNDEHQSFLIGLKLYGKNWKKVEEHVGTRTGAQIRSHA